MAAFSTINRCVPRINSAFRFNLLNRYQSGSTAEFQYETKIDSCKDDRLEISQTENMLDIGARRIYNQDHDMFRRSVRRFLLENVLPNQMRYEKQGFVDREMWEMMGKAGMLGVATSTEMGGHGAEFKFASIVDEEQCFLNDVGTNGWKVHSNIVMPYIEEYGTTGQQQKYLPDMTAGKLIGAIAMTEPQAGSDLQGIRTNAKRDGEDWILNGSKVFISNGYVCDMVIVVAITDLQAKHKAHGISLFLVDADSAGFSKGKPLQKIGQKATDTAELFFDDVRLPKEALLGDEPLMNKGFYCLMKQLPRERLIVSLSAQALSECMFEMTREYVKQRQVFGKSLSNFQTVQHRLAEMKTEICVTRSFADQCLDMFGENRLDNSSVSMLKYRTTDLSTKVASECLQLHGGWGYMLEHPIARAFTSAKVNTIYGGTSEVMKELIARDICAVK